MSVEELSVMTENIDMLSRQLYAGQLEQAQKTLGDTVCAVNNIYLSYVQRQKKFQNMGIKFPAEVLLSQMQNLLDAVENQDILKMADTFCYEIKNGLMYFMDIEKELS